MERSDGNIPYEVTCTCVYEREREESSKSCIGRREILWYMNNTW